MKHTILISTLIALICCGAQRPEQTGMSSLPTVEITTDIANEIEIGLAGRGEIVIDWGDGSEPVTVRPRDLDLLGDFILDRFSHTYAPDYNIKTIVITGDFTGLDIFGFQATELCLNGITALKYLDCTYNHLTSLDVSKNSALTELYCYENRLTALDVSGNPELVELNCSANSLTELDVSGNPALTVLECAVNALTTLDVSKNIALTELSCNHNQITSLGVSVFPELTSLVCSGNKLDAHAISAILSKLPAINEEGKYREVWYDGNPGTAAADASIAAAKGWRVFGT